MSIEILVLEALDVYIFTLYYYHIFVKVKIVNTLIGILFYNLYKFK